MYGEHEISNELSNEKKLIRLVRKLESMSNALALVSETKNTWYKNDTYKSLKDWIKIWITLAPDYGIGISDELQVEITLALLED